MLFRAVGYSRAAAGMYSVPMAEFAVCGILQLYKQSCLSAENQARHSGEKYNGLRELPDFDGVLPLDKLADAAAACDILVCCIALTPETRGIVSKEVFDHLPVGAIFVNIARGALADEAALTAWLQSGGHAVLDVFEEEPMPESSPLWDMENVIVTPHNSFVGEGNRERMWEMIRGRLG